MGMILRIASSRIVGQGDIVGRSGYFSLNLSANSVMRGRLDARRTLKSLVADLRVDACAFQDGHIDYDELDAFFTVNKKLADKYGMKCWTNAETFDRDMPIDFLPIKFDKLRMKLEAAKRAGYDKAITFEFSHFMSPQSAYLQAGHLYNRYKEYFNIK